MDQITLRGIPADIESLARKEAKNKSLSLNKAFLYLLRKGADQLAMNRRGKKHRGSEFGPFLGLWGKDEAAGYDASMQDQRQIDKELWP